MKKIYVLLLLVGGTSLLYGQKLSIDSEASFVNYQAKHPAHVWNGVNQKLQGLAIFENELPKQLAIKAQVRDFDSENASRDSHALEVLDALQFPEVRFYSKSIVIENNKELIIEGVLTFHGVEIPKTVRAEYSWKDSSFHLEGSFDFSATDFGVRLPSFLLIKINERIEIDYAISFISNL